MYFIIQPDQPVDYSAAEHYIKGHYKKLVQLTIDDNMIRTLYQEEVITLEQQKEIKRLHKEERMEYLLDDVITPSVKCKDSPKFIHFINTLRSSDDTSLKDVACDLMCCLHK